MDNEFYVIAYKASAVHGSYRNSESLEYNTTYLSPSEFSFTGHETESSVIETLKRVKSQGYGEIHVIPESAEKDLMERAFAEPADEPASEAALEEGVCSRCGKPTYIDLDPFDGCSAGYMSTLCACPPKE